MWGNTVITYFNFMLWRWWVHVLHCKILSGVDLQCASFIFRVYLTIAIN